METDAIEQAKVYWDQTVLQLGGNFLQSRAWGDFQQSLGHQMSYSMSGGWEWAGAIRSARGGFKYIMLSYGPTAQDATNLGEAVENLKVIAQQSGADFVRMEPIGNFDESAIKATGAQRFGEVNPEYTRVLDITKSEDELKSALESGHRQRVNAAARRGITVRVAKDTSEVSIFNDMMADTARHNKIKVYDPSYYQKLYEVLATQNKGQLYIAEHEGQPVASAICFDWGMTRYYAYAAAYQDKNRQIGASVVQVWQMILDAKAAGKTSFDFWGVAPSDAGPEHKWAGLSAFKRAFGGVDVHYHGSWDLPIKAQRYKLYRLAKHFA